jgi:hypothetical protein
MYCVALSETGGRTWTDLADRYAKKRAALWVDLTVKRDNNDDGIAETDAESGVEPSLYLTNVPSWAGGW